MECESIASDGAGDWLRNNSGLLLLDDGEIVGQWPGEFPTAGCALVKVSDVVNQVRGLQLVFANPGDNYLGVLKTER